MAKVAKDLKYYLSLNYPMLLVWDKDDRAWFVEFPDLLGCIAHGKTPTRAVNLAQQRKREWLVEAIKDRSHIALPGQDAKEDAEYICDLEDKLEKARG